MIYVKSTEHCRYLYYLHTIHDHHLSGPGLRLRRHGDNNVSSAVQAGQPPAIQTVDTCDTCDTWPARQGHGEDIIKANSSCREYKTLSPARSIDKFANTRPITRADTSVSSDNMFLQLVQRGVFNSVVSTLTTSCLVFWYELSGGSPVPLRPHAAKLCIVSYGNAGAGLVVAGGRVCVNFPH